MLAYAAPAAAQTSAVIHACIGPAEITRIVSGPAACRPIETPISWNQQGPEGPEGLQGLRGIQGEPGAPAEGGGLKILDANGTVVGPYLPNGSSDGVLVRPDVDNTVLLLITTGSIVKNTGPFSAGFLMWIDPLCQGDVYFSVPGATKPLINRSHVIFQGDEMVYADYAATPTPLPVFLLLPTFGPQGLTFACGPGGNVAVTPTKRWTPPYVAPFRLE